MGADDLLPELERVYLSLLPQFCRVAAAITGDRETGADAVHDAFVGCVRNAAGYRGEGTVEAWVWRAVVNSALRIHRDARPSAELGPAVLGSAENGHAPDRSASVRAALSLLPERQRQVLFLRYFADLDYRTIAEVLGIAVGTVGAALHQAHAALRASLSEEVAE